MLEKYNLPTLNQEEIENMNRPITTNEIETVIKNLPTNKNPGSNGFRLQMESDEFYQTFKEALTPILIKLFQKIAEGGTLQNSFYEATYHPNTKIRQRHHKKILQKSHNIKTLSCHKSYGMVLTYIQRKNEAEYRARVKAKCP